MAIGIYTIKCPECGASLDVEEGRKNLFCSYCGSKVMINNENEHIYRHIDEARIKEAEIEREIKLKQMEIESEDTFSKKKLVKIWLVVTGALLIVGIIGSIFKVDGVKDCLEGGAMVGVIGVMYFSGMFGYTEIGKRKQKKVSFAGPGEVVITEEMENSRGKYYDDAILLFKAAGFNDVQSFPLNDLTRRYEFDEDGRVSIVSINGASSYEEGDVFPVSAKVIIRYHSIKK